MSSETVIVSLLGHKFKLASVLWPSSPELVAMEEPCWPPSWGCCTSTLPALLNPEIQLSNPSVGTTNVQGTVRDFAKEVKETSFLKCNTASELYTSVIGTDLAQPQEKCDVLAGPWGL